MDKANLSKTTTNQSRFEGFSGVSIRKRVPQALIKIFFIFYAVLTITPFFFLFVRSFIATKEATDLHLWPPPIEDVSMEADIGNLSIFFNLDLQKVKEDLGIPTTDYLNPKWKLNRIAEEYGIPEETLQSYFRPFTRFNGWIVLFNNEDFWPAIARTVVVTGLGIVGINVLGILTGTALAGIRFKYQRFVYALFLFKIAIPPFLILLPQFWLVNQVQSWISGADTPGLTRQISQLAVIVALYIQGGALSVMIFTSAIGAIPHDLEESAEIDGASRLQYIRYILLPLMKVPIASLTVIVLPLFWNDFLQPFVYLDPGNATLLPLIQSFTGQYTTNFQVVFTGVFVSVLPLVIIYLLFRNWFIAGVMEGAIKG